jgi:hypothetical protein
MQLAPSRGLVLSVVKIFLQFVLTASDRLLKSLLWFMLVGLISFLIGMLERP